MEDDLIIKLRQVHEELEALVQTSQELNAQSQSLRQECADLVSQCEQSRRTARHLRSFLVDVESPNQATSP